MSQSQVGWINQGTLETHDSAAALCRCWHLGGEVLKNVVSLSEWYYKTCLKASDRPSLSQKRVANVAFPELARRGRGNSCLSLRWNVKGSWLTC